MKNRTDIWQIEGAFIYKLRSAGFRKGVDTFENEYSIQVNTHRNTEIDSAKEIAQKICTFLNSEVNK